MPTLRLGCLLLLLVPAAEALAHNTADAADIAFELGNTAWARRRYTEALHAWHSSYLLVPNRNVLFNIARCYEALRRYDEAYRYYGDLEREPLGAEDSQQVRQALERLRPRVALVHVATEPPGAEVYVEREDLGPRGSSPQALALPPGRHTVLVRKPGYHPARQEVLLERGRTARLELVLEQITGTLELHGTPLGAQVRWLPEGTLLGQLPATVRLPPGRHLLQVLAPGHVEAQHLVEVPAQGHTRLQVALRPQQPPTGRLVVTANRTQAQVRMNGQPAGFTPTVLLLPPGEYQVEVAARETEPLRQRVSVVAGEQVAVHAELRYAPPPVRAASKGLLPVDEAPASTTVLSREELRAFGWSTLAEALAGVRGLFLTQDRVYTYLGVRGFSPPGDLNTRVLLLWNGHPLNDLWAGQGYLGRELSVDLEEVERVEVVRGPGSALYGTGAFFAVLNVVTRDSLGEGRHAEAGGAVGALGTVRAHAAAAWGQGEQWGVVSAAAVQVQGAESTRLGEQVVWGQDEERAATASLQARLGALSLQAQLNTRRKQVPTGAGNTVPGAGTHVEDVRGFAEARYESALGERLRLEVRGSLDASRYQGQWVYGLPEGGLEPQVEGGGATWLGGEARLGLRLAEGHQLTLGLEALASLHAEQRGLRGADDTTPLALPARRLLSAYLQDEWSLHPRLSVSAGLRVDAYLDSAAVPLTPRLALIARPYTGGLTKLVAGSAFRAPNLYELYYQDELRTQRAPLRLEPESIATFELEHAHDLTRELRLTLAAYHNRMTRLVVLEQEEGGPQCGTPPEQVHCLVFANDSGETVAWGAEAGLRWQPERHLLVDLGYSHVRLRTTAGVELAAPEHLATGRLLTPLAGDGLRLALQATWQSAWRSRTGTVPESEALLVGLGLSGEWEQLRYFAGVHNLLDVRYVLPVNGQVPVPQYGRTFTLQLTGSF
jgi:outer membrane receptor for ferrienterochelin and colicins